NGRKRERIHMPERDLLMIPGPTMVDPAVLRALSTPVQSMSTPAFINLFGESLEGVRMVLGAQKGQVYVIPGSGHLALEFGVANLVEPSDKVLILDHGFFSQVYRLICERYDPQITVLTAPFGDAVPLAAIEAELQKGYKVVHVVHVETSTDVCADVPA